MLNIVFYIFLGLLIFAPLAFGSTEPWSLTIMEGLSFLALCLYLILARWKRIPLVSIPGLLPLLLWLGYLGFQLVPLPAGLVKFFSPQTFALYEDTIGLIEPLGALSISVNLKAGLTEFFRYAACGAFYVLTVQLLSRGDLLKKTIVVVIIFAALLSIEAILQFLFSEDYIYWLRHMPINSMIVGPYGCHNHYAGLMEMVFPLAFGLFFYYRPRVTYNLSLRQRLAQVLNQSRTNVHLLLGLASVVIAASILFSLSRAGIVCFWVGIVMLVGMLSQKGMAGKGLLVLTIFLGLVGLLIGRTGWEGVLGRYALFWDPAYNELRPTYWMNAVALIRDFPLFGTGAGTFVDTFQAYRTDELFHLVVDHAHNDYLELLAEGGGVAALLLAWFLAAVLFRSTRAYRTRRDRYSICLFVGSLAGIVALLLHSAVDFNFHIGANSLYFFFLLGLAVSSAHTGLHGPDTSLLARLDSPRTTMLSAVAVLVVFIAGLALNLGILVGQYHFASVSSRFWQSGPDTTPDVLGEIKEGAARAATFDPLEPLYRYAGACVAVPLNDPAFLKQYLAALRLRPANGEYLQRVGLSLAAEGDDRTAEKFLQAGVKFDPLNPDRFETQGAWLLRKGAKEQGLTAFRRAIELNPGQTEHYLTAMVLLGLEEPEIARAIPEQMEPQLFFADYLASASKTTLAEDHYRLALSFADQSRNPQSGHFLKLASHYEKQGRNEEALAVLKKAGMLIPDHVGIKLTTGALYERLNISYRATEEYKNVLVLEPANKTAQQRLEKLQGKVGGVPLEIGRR